MTKFGPTYRIQVKLKDKVSGKMNVYSTTWKPKIGMTLKQMEREVIVYANQYEDNLRIQDPTQNQAHVARDPVTCKEKASYRR